ncbi:MAG: hypothetical protein P4L22_05575 [Candidatus Babeliales bacterium]|nr:hypothetical protein [Candidatus Babeliales bacterium]
MKNLLKLSFALAIFINNVFAYTDISCQEKCLTPVNECIAKNKCLDGKKNYLQCLKKNCYQKTVNASICKKRCQPTCADNCKLPVRECYVKNNCVSAKNPNNCLAENCSDQVNIGKQCIANCPK